MAKFFAFGIVKNSLDTKNRILIPAEVRDKLQKDDKGESRVYVIVTQGCFPHMDCFYDLDEFENEVERRTSLESRFEDPAIIQIKYSGNCAELPIDAQFRTKAIPSVLIEHAEFCKNLVVICSKKYFSVYSEEIYAKASERVSEDARSESEQMRRALIEEKKAKMQRIANGDYLDNPEEC